MRSMPPTSSGTSSRTRRRDGGPMTDSQLANDRTFLAWLRTGIALIGLGFVIAKVSLIAEPGTGAVSDQALYSGVGVFVVLSGAALVLFGSLQHASLERAFAGGSRASGR